MYYPDLSPYTYSRSPSGSEVVNVGWLEKPHFFPQGTVPEHALDRLFLLCLQPVNRTRGHHTCQFCQNPSVGFRAERNDKEAWLGSAEIRLTGKNGRVYAAPDLIYHYITDHCYRPPDEFVAALIADPQPLEASPPRLNPLLKTFAGWIKRGRSEQTSQPLTREEIIALAQAECDREGWPWLEPVVVQDHWSDWTVVTNYNMRGRNARIVIGKKTGQIVKKSFIPR